jgi:two-component system chemotaxis sensor kinase CheA
MKDFTSNEPMMDIFIFETAELIEQLEQLVLDGEKVSSLEPHINEIFRIMHTIKGSSAMMLLNNISSLAHSIEDVFYFLRENAPHNVNYSILIDIILECIDFIKNEINKIKAGKASYGDPTKQIITIKELLCKLNCNDTLNNRSESNTKYSYKAVIFFEADCEMENIGAFTILHKLRQIASELSYYPENITDEENDSCIDIIRKQGFTIRFSSALPVHDIRHLLEQTIFLRRLDLFNIRHTEDDGTENISGVPDGYKKLTNDIQTSAKDHNISHTKQNFLSVNIAKMDILMDLVGELVISEAMVTQNPDLKGLQLENFNKSAIHLKKITGELQDIVMSIRMVPLSGTFQKMNRIIRDMCKKLNRNVDLEILGEETEVDKNIIEHISDPLMHLIRNSVDHGIETAEERLSTGKSLTGKITLEAKNLGGDVWIIVKDDGRGLDKNRILEKARAAGLINKPENELTDNEIFSFIFIPGFSTNTSITEFSGRGVGMDVVTKNIESIRGSIIINSMEGKGTTVSIKIPLTLAIVDGMLIRAGNSTYTIPVNCIKESIKIKQNQLIRDTENNELIILRGECYPILRLHNIYNLKSAVTNIEDGIVIITECDGSNICIFADELLGELQVVVKALPKYIKKVKGISGCTLLGDGSISLILDIAELVNSIRERRNANDTGTRRRNK